MKLIIKNVILDSDDNNKGLKDFYVRLIVDAEGDKSIVMKNGEIDKVKLVRDILNGDVEICGKNNR